MIRELEHRFVERLLKAHEAPSEPPRWDPTVAHVLATIAGYAYSDAATVAMIAARLGLVEPEMANRFLLWGIGAGMAGSGSLIGMLVGLAYGQPMSKLPLLTLVLSLCGLASAIALWLAFAAPESWKNRVRN
mgnify:CR=1 FL=1